MPNVTRTVAKGIAPRTHLPPKPKKKNSRKRNADDSSADETETESNDPLPKAKAKKHKRQRKVSIESVEELETVDDTAKPLREEVEVVSDENDEPGASEVSINPL
jgi:hypothetical protein